MKKGAVGLEEVEASGAIGKFFAEIKFLIKNYRVKLIDHKIDIYVYHLSFFAVPNAFCSESTGFVGLLLGFAARRTFPDCGHLQFSDFHIHCADGKVSRRRRTE